MKDSVLLHRKGKPYKKFQHNNIPDAWACWNKTAELAHKSGLDDLAEKHRPDEGAGWYTIYRAEEKLRQDMVWCEVCECWVDRADLKIWTGDDRKHYLCPGCDSDLLPVDDIDE